MTDDETPEQLREQRNAAWRDLAKLQLQCMHLCDNWDDGGMKRGETRVSLRRCAKQLRNLLP